jgi:hypothetical protein
MPSIHPLRKGKSQKKWKKRISARDLPERKPPWKKPPGRSNGLESLYSLASLVVAKGGGVTP